MSNHMFSKINPDELGALAAKNLKAKQAFGPTIDFSNAEVMKCTNENCDSQLFENALRLLRVSPLASGTGQEVIGIEPVIVCKKCGQEVKINN